MTRVILIAVVSMLAAGYAYADDDTPSLDDIPHITIVGTAHVAVQPDLATITLGVRTEQPTAKGAAAENARKAQAVIDAAKAAGVSAIDIATQTATLTQTFDPIKDDRGIVTGRKPRGFAAANVVAIRVHDLAKAGAIAGDLIGEGANRFDGVQFSVEHPEPILAKLTGAAVKDARDHAETAVDAAGVHLGRVLMIAKSDPQSFAYPRPGALRAFGAAPAPAPVPLEAGTISFTASVVVTWALDQK